MPCGLISNNQPTFIALLGLLGTLSAVVITQCMNLKSKKLDHTQSIKLKRIEINNELQKQYLFEPIISFLDSDLKHMQKIFSNKITSGTDGDVIEIDKKHIFDLATIEARIKCIGDSKLNEKFNKFSQGRISIGTFLADSKHSAAHAQLKTSILLAGEVLEFLFEKLNKLEN